MNSIHQLLVDGSQRHHLEVSDVKYLQVDLENIGNTAYTGAMMFGTPLQGDIESQFYFDSTVTYTSVTTTECTNCNTTYYNGNASSTYKSVPGITGIQYQLPTVEVTG